MFCQFIFRNSFSVNIDIHVFFNKKGKGGHTNGRDEVNGDAVVCPEQQGGLRGVRHEAEGEELPDVGGQGGVEVQRVGLLEEARGPAAHRDADDIAARLGRLLERRPLFVAPRVVGEIWWGGFFILIFFDSANCVEYMKTRELNKIYILIYFFNACFRLIIILISLAFSS